MNREEITTTIKKAIKEHTKDTEQINKSWMKKKMNSQNKITKSSYVKNRLNAVSSLII